MHAAKWTGGSEADGPEVSRYRAVRVASHTTHSTSHRMLFRQVTEVTLSRAGGQGLT